MDEDEAGAFIFGEMPTPGFKFSLFGCFVDVLEAILGNLKAHHNYKLDRTSFHEDAAIEIETLTE